MPTKARNWMTTPHAAARLAFLVAVYLQSPTRVLHVQKTKDGLHGLHHRARRPHLVDGTACCGGNTLAFALSGTFSRVTAVEANRSIYDSLVNNIAMYGLLPSRREAQDEQHPQSRQGPGAPKFKKPGPCFVQPYHGDVNQVLSGEWKLEADVLFLDPVWGHKHPDMVLDGLRWQGLRGQGLRGHGLRGQGRGHGAQGAPSCLSVIDAVARYLCRRPWQIVVLKTSVRFDGERLARRIRTLAPIPIAIDRYVFEGPAFPSAYSVYVILPNSWRYPRSGTRPQDRDGLGLDRTLCTYVATQPDLTLMAI